MVDVEGKASVGVVSVLLLRLCVLGCVGGGSLKLEVRLLRRDSLGSELLLNVVKRSSLLLLKLKLLLREGGDLIKVGLL